MRRIIIAAVICTIAFVFSYRNNVAAETVIDCNMEPEDQIIQYGDFLDGPNCGITPVGDLDIFRFEGRIGEKIIVQATDQSGGLQTACITLLGPDGMPTLNGAKRCVGLTARIDETIEVDGEHVVIVDEGTGRTMPYSLAIDRVAPTFSPGAPPICFGCNIADVIDGVGDMDLYVFSLPSGDLSGDVIRAQATDTTGGLQTACITLYGSDGMPTPNGARRCAGLTALIDETLQLDGAHAILVEEGTGRIMSYSADLQCILGDCPEPPPICNGLEATIIGTEDDNVIIGTDGDDVIVGLGGNDIIYGLDGRDRICGGDGDDTIYGGLRNDRLYGDAGNDILRGEGSRDFLFGGGGNDTLDGGPWHDVLNGGWGNDTLFGSVGDDELIGNVGLDVCDGGNHVTGDTADDTCECNINVEFLP